MDHSPERLNRATDRCDAGFSGPRGDSTSCQAQAFILFQRVNKDTGVQDFLFCGHHGRKYQEALENQGWTMVGDWTDTINEKPSVSAIAE